MRAPLAAAAILLLAPLLPAPAGAAEGFLSDPKGDVAFDTPGAAVPASHSQSDDVDLLSMELLETADDLEVVLAVAAFGQPMSFSQYEVHFTWNDMPYTAVLRRNVVPALAEENTFAYLVNDDTERWDPVAYLEHSLDHATGTLRMTIPKAYVLDGADRMPLQGSSLTDVYVESQQDFALFAWSGSLRDRMPDEGEASYAIRVGDVATGHLRLDADERVRVSNGGATTFVFQATLTNRGDAPDEVALTLEDVPDGWEGTVQSPVRLDGQGETVVTVLASVPFEHDHGGYSSFNLTARSQRDPAAMAVVRLGVLHTPIPQPAGHHSDLYLHAQRYNGGVFGTVFPWTGATMNTVSAHEDDAAEATPSGDDDGPVWHVPLSPGLRMGLDFDLSRTGTLVGSIMGHQKEEGTLSAELVLWREDEELVLATSDEAAVALDVNTAAPFKLTLTPTEDADYVPHQKDQNLALVLRLEHPDGSPSFCCMPGTMPGLQTSDFKMTLPLNEYHDRLRAQPQAARALDVVAVGAVEKSARPGTVVAYEFNVTNGGPDGAYVFDLAGSDADLATLVPWGPVDMASGETRRATLAVTVPPDANEGEVFEALLFVRAQDDPSRMAIVRTLTTATYEDGATPDETGVLLAAQRDDQETPGAGALAALAALAGAAVAARRRR